MAEMTQEEINTFVEGIMPFFEQEPIPEDADQVSWPRLDRGLSDVQDMKRFQHLYGVFDRSGYPFNLVDFRNEDNTALLTVSTTTGTAECTIHGAFQMMRKSRRLHFPMPPAGGGPVTYYVTSEYSPQRASEGGDPIEIVVTTGPPSYSQGRNYIIHWKLTRNPNELLTDAAVERVEPRVTQTIYVWAEDHKPDPERQLWGTLCVVGQTGTVYRAAGSDGWQQIVPAVMKWTDYSDTDNYVAVPGRRRWQMGRLGKRRQLRGSVARRSGALFNTVNTYNVLTVEPRDCPASDERMPIAVQGGAKSAWIEIKRNGQCFVEVSGDCSWVSLSGVEWEVD